MCRFCYALLNSKPINLSVRSTYAEDNLSEFVSENNGSFESCGFKLTGGLYKDNVYFGVEYREEHLLDDKLIVSPFSETFQFNFCPLCGKQISKTIKSFEDNYSHIISLDDDIETDYVLNEE